MNTSKIKKHNKSYHFIFWVLIWLFYNFFFSYNSNHINFSVALSTYLIPVTAIATYTMVEKLIPKYLIEKKYMQFGIFSFISILFSTFCILIFLIVSVSFIPDFKAINLPPLGKNYVFIILLIYLVVALVSFSSLWKRNSLITITNAELQKELTEIKYKAKEQELIFLKNQIHPHFLFNSLNTIYGLALKKSEKTPNVILKLSSLLDYVLYQSNKQEVLLKNELKHIEDYINLEKTRFNETLKVIYTKSILNDEVMVAPMMLLPFVENAFKHGSMKNNSLMVFLDITVSNTELNFHIKNTFDHKISKKGIGLRNIKDRLELLYPNNYSLQIDTNSDLFEVKLSINHFKQNTL